MKITVIDNGKEKLIETSGIYVDGKPIGFFIEEHKKLVKEFKSLKSHLEKREKEFEEREKELVETWKKYR